MAQMEWVDNLRRIAANPMNVVAGNSLYEVHYIKYHTGIEALYLPSWCGDKLPESKEYRPTRHEILLGPYRDNLDYPRFSEEEAWKHPIMVSLQRAVKTHTGTQFVFRRMRELYPR